MKHIFDGVLAIADYDDIDAFAGLQVFSAHAQSAKDEGLPTRPGPLPMPPGCLYHPEHSD